MNNEHIIDWQRKFLEEGTRQGWGDLSSMIGTVSEILNLQKAEIVKEIVEKYGEYNDGCGCCSIRDLETELKALSPEPTPEKI